MAPVVAQHVQMSTGEMRTPAIPYVVRALHIACGAVALEVIAQNASQGNTFLRLTIPAWKTVLTDTMVRQFKI